MYARAVTILDGLGNAEHAELSKGTPVTKALIKIQSRLRREDGATAVEYGLMVALIAVVIIAAVTLLGGNLSTLFNGVASSV